MSRPHVAGPWTEMYENKNQSDESEHDHVWEYLRTDDDWWDGDSEDVYRCTVQGCTARDYRYIPR